LLFVDSKWFFAGNYFYGVIFMISKLYANNLMMVGRECFSPRGQHVLTFVRS
jgi:hypothetical protein